MAVRDPYLLVSVQSRISFPHGSEAEATFADHEPSLVSTSVVAWYSPMLALLRLQPKIGS